MSGDGKVLTAEEVRGVRSKYRAKIKNVQKIVNPLNRLEKKELDILFNSFYLSQIHNLLEKSYCQGMTFNKTQIEAVFEIEAKLAERLTKTPAAERKKTAARLVNIKERFGWEDNLGTHKKRKSAIGK